MNNKKISENKINTIIKDMINIHNQNLINFN